MKDFMDSEASLLLETHSDAERGLTEAQISANRQKYGANAFSRRKPESVWRRIWEAATEPMILMLIAAGLIALAVNIIRDVTGAEADYLECVGVFVAISISVIISVVMGGQKRESL